MKARGDAAVANGDLTLLALLKACGRKKDMRKGMRIHDHICRGTTEGQGGGEAAAAEKKRSRRRSPYLASAMVSMYAKCGMMAEAEQVLRSLPVRDMASWSAFIHGLSGHRSFEAMAEMQREGIPPNVVTFTSIFKACSDTCDLQLGKKMHSDAIIRKLLEEEEEEEEEAGSGDAMLGTALVDMYAKCGELCRAREVLDELPFRITASWNALISGFVRSSRCHEAMACFDALRSENLCPDHVTFACILTACAGLAAMEIGAYIHHEILSQPRIALHRDAVLRTALVDMYAKCGALPEAQSMLFRGKLRALDDDDDDDDDDGGGGGDCCSDDDDVVAWNALIAGYVRHGEACDALDIFFKQMRRRCVPNAATFICILMACGTLGDIRKGQEIHLEIARRKLISADDVMLGTALVDMYAKCGALGKAREALEALPVRNVVTWNALLAGYAERGECDESLHCYKRIQMEGLYPDEVTFLCMLKACGSARAIEKGKQVHGEVCSSGFLEKDPVLGNALVDMYAKCGLLSKAQQVLKSLPTSRVDAIAAWNALIVGYVHEERCDEAIECFECMQREGPPPDELTFIALLSACASIGAIEKGEEAHREIASKELVQKDLMLGNALVDMYTKCSAFDKAWQMLEELPIRDVVSWSTLICGYGELGRAEEALECFESMQCEGLLPNAVTLLSVLAACSHAGLLEEARGLFVSMSSRFQIVPNEEHHTCMVAGLGYAGYFDEALLFIEMIPSLGCGCPLGWLALLGACRKWRNTQLGILCFDQIMQSDGGCATAYSVMADIYVASGMEADARIVEAMSSGSSSQREHRHHLSRIGDVYAKVQRNVMPEMMEDGYFASFLSG